MMNSNEKFNPEQMREHWRQHHRKGRWIKFPVFILIGVLLKSGLIYLIWNHLVPELFHGPEITYLNTIELLVLAKLILGMGGMMGMGALRGFKRRFEHLDHGHGHGHGHGNRWDGLSSEEREALREMIRERGEK